MTGKLLRIKQILEMLKRTSDPSFILKARPHWDGTAKLTLSRTVNYQSGRIVIGSQSILTIEDNVQICGDILVGANCCVKIGRDSIVTGVVLRFEEGARVELGPMTIFDAPPHKSNEVHVRGGQLEFADHVRMQGSVIVSPGAVLKIGSYTGVGHGSEIRAEERVSIGSYCMISYNTLIFDTNTHSTDWRVRRAYCESNYPIAKGIQPKPDTAEVQIGDDVWIGEGAAVLKGASIGNRCIIGTRTVVGSMRVGDDSSVVSAKPRVIARPPHSPDSC